MPPLPHTLISPSFPSPPTTLSFSKKSHFLPPRQYPLPRFHSHAFSSSLRLPRCSLQAVSTEAPVARGEPKTKLSPAEISRTIMELSSTGTLSTLTQDGWPLGVGARFVVDDEGTPVLCLNHPDSLFAVDGRSSFHVEFEQSGSRTPQCTLMGNVTKASDELLLKKLRTKWEKKFGEEVDQDLVYLISVERIFHMEDFKEDGIWVPSSEYISAEPDPLRNFAEKIVEEMNSRHAEDVQRLCHVYVESGFQVMDAKMIWVDRLGFDMHLYSNEGLFAVRIPFPREVTDEKGVKSSFNSMSHLAWEVEKNYAVPDFQKVEGLKKIR
ncbi:glutamyl-tRNA reductase-binding protein, chloroplastic [Typha latifolia]|uniref:glutamyl-tRNA reductase-binding protein, chloroplastic n=1 Tax=Typha latifolia TaxID=4733 RepID=UPI003C2FCE02